MADKDSDKKESIAILSRINNALSEKRLTRYDLSKGAGIAKTTVLSWFTRVTVPNTLDMIKISRFLNLSVSYLILGDQEENKEHESERERISPEEKGMLEMYRKLTPKEKDFFDILLKLYLAKAI